MFSKKLLKMVTLVAAMLLGLGCSKEGGSALDPDLGNVSMAVVMDDGSMVHGVHWAITDASDVLVREGDIVVTDPAATISTFISGLPVGMGYTMTLSADLLGADGNTIVGDCLQTATFNVTAGQVTSLTMTLNCTYDETEGDLILNAEANLCPTIDYMVVNPLDQAIGQAITLHAEASDGDGDAVTYAWSAAPDIYGTVNNDTSADASFICTVSTPINSPVTLTLEVDDGQACHVQRSVEVTCSTPFICGNGILEPGEQCDPTDFIAMGGSQTPCDEDDCSASCQIEICGNGVKECGEICDDGNENDLDECSNACIKPGCPNGFVDTNRGETCDDNNSTACDGCSASCQIEICGNGVKECDEACDDGNQIAGDGCEPDCTPTPDLCDACSVASCSNYQGRNMYSDCYEGATSAACIAVMECAHSTGCVLEAADGTPWPTDQINPNKCYCGTAPQANCMAGQANGECKAVIEVAAETTDPMTIGTRFTNTNYAVGDASTLLICERNFCSALCL